MPSDAPQPETREELATQLAAHATEVASRYTRLALSTTESMVGGTYGNKAFAKDAAGWWGSMLSDAAKSLELLGKYGRTFASDEKA